MAHHTRSLLTIHKKPEPSFYFAWIALTFLCVPIAYVLDLVLLRIITSFVGDFIYVKGVQHITEDYLALYIFVPIFGLLTGVLQYALLQRYLPRMGWWILATMGGWFLGILLLVLIDRLIWARASFNLDFVFIVIGLSIGIGQWILLRRHLPGAGWWIVANVAGWGLLALITKGNSVDQFGIFTLGLIPACATSVTLALLMNKIQSTEPQNM